MNQKAFFKTFLGRELFSRKTYSLQIILSVAIGVGAVAGIQSYKSSLVDRIRSQAQNLMGADLAFQTPEKVRLFQRELLARSLPPGTQTGEVVQFLSMLQSGEEVALSLVRAMEPQYPFYGEIRTEPRTAYKDLAENGILLEENLARNLGVSLGSSVQLGQKMFRFQGTILQEPGSLGGFVGMAPTSLIRTHSLEGSGLEERGSRIRYTIFAKLAKPEIAKKFKQEHSRLYADNDLTIYHNTETNSGSQVFITNTLDFLGLMGLASFFLGAIAIFISTRTRVTDSQKHLAILKCLGLQSRYAQGLVLSETLILSVIGSLLGLGLGYWIQSSLPSFLGGVDAVSLGGGLTGVAILEGISLGLLVPMVVSIHSLVKAADVSPLIALKNPEGVSLDESGLSHRLGRWEYLLLVAVYILFYGIAILDTGSWLKALVLCSVFVFLPGIIWILYIAMRNLLGILSRQWEMPRVLSLVVKKFIRQYGLISLSVIGLGSAIFVLLLSLVLRESLLNLGGSRQITKRPNVFIMDIRKEQEADFEKIVSQYPIEDYRRAPVMRGRLVKINGEVVDRSQVDQEAAKTDWRASARTREYMLSYRKELYDTESVAVGRFWKSDGVNEISVEKEFAKYLRAGVGDTLEFSLEGFPFVRLVGKITNLRTVNWSDMKPNFVVLFSGGDLESVPGFYLASLNLASNEDRFRLQKELVRKFPNITVIDTEKAVKSFEGIVEKVSAIINLMSMLLVFASVLLLVSVLYSSSRERLEELVFYRLVGARQTMVRGLVFQEATLLAFFSFASGLTLAMLTDWILNRFLLELESVYPWGSIVWVAILVWLGVVIAYYTTTRKLFHLPVKSLMKG